MKIRTWLLSCEHGGKRVPPAYRHLFATARARRALAGHRGYDVGALDLATELAARLRVPLFAGEVTRLLVDLNRSSGHPHLFSEFSSRLDPERRRDVVARHYLPHRDRIAQAIDAAEAGPVCHVAVHSFSATWRGEKRRADVGLLYDPARPLERALCGEWRSLLLRAAPGLRVRRNYPYRGVADGLTTALRRRFPDPRYAGIELEVNQALLLRGPQRRRIVETIAASLLALRKKAS